MRKRRIFLSVGFGILAMPALTFTVLALLNSRTGAATNFSKSRYLIDPPPPMSEPITIKVITYNIADAYLFTTNRLERMRAIATRLIELDPDIVGFQESFIAKDRKVLLDALAQSRLKYYAVFPAATVGNGLLIVSAWPIAEQYFHRFQASNPWYRIGEGDWWAGKGVGLARLALPGGYCIDFYDTHAQAGRHHPTGYLEVRTGQMQELASFVRSSRTGTGPGFVVGDFNTGDGDADLQAAVTQTPLLRMMNRHSGIDHIYAVSDPRYIFEVLETSEIRGKVMGSHADIFLSRAPSWSELKRMWWGEGEETDMSDHSGYMSTIRIRPNPASPVS